MADSLTDKQQRFVEEYLVDLNATQAAKRAGYSQNTAQQMGWENLSKPLIADAIAKAKAERSKRTEVTQDKVLRELARIGFSDLRNVMNEGGSLANPDSWDDDTAASIGSIELVTRTAGFDSDGNREVEYVSKIKTWDKGAALEKLARHLGMFDGRGGSDINIHLHSDAKKV